MHFFRIVALICFLAITSACSLLETRQQLSNSRDQAIFKGVVVNNSGFEGQAYVLLLKDISETQITWQSISQVYDSGEFVIYSKSGTYILGSYLDTNGNGEFDRGIEPSGYIKNKDGTPRTFEAQDISKFTGLTVDIDGLIEPDKEREFEYVGQEIATNFGEVISLDDCKFSESNASLGMWRPKDFLERVGGGLYFLSEYESRKTPILFIHGINGTPLNFKKVIADLDKERYTPWILHYPSGLRLDIVSSIALQAISRLQKKHQFNKINIVAHSMGGLVARDLVRKFSEDKINAEIGLVMTINSPLYGMKSAAHGATYSPMVVPSWIDVAAGSDFIKKIHSWKWQDKIPYYLVFSYGAGDGSDGVVSLDSQLSETLQEEAKEIYGFNALHTSILEQPQFTKYLNQILSSHYSE